MNRQSRPYFYGIGEQLNFQQRSALAQGIQQVVDTTPRGFNFFEFRFIDYDAYVYKLDNGLTLLVLTDHEVILDHLRGAIDELRLELKDEEGASAIALFRMIAGNLPLPSDPLLSVQDAPEVALPQTQPSAATQPAEFNPFSINDPSISVAKAAEVDLRSEGSREPSLASAPDASSSANLLELLNGINQISQFTIQYLGNTVVSNYWKATRPSTAWLNQFQIDRSAQITFTGPLPIEQQTLNSQQQAWVQEWVQAFAQRCAIVIRNFPALLIETGLNPQQRALLLPPKPE